MLLILGAAWIFAAAAVILVDLMPKPLKESDHLVIGSVAGSVLIWILAAILICAVVLIVVAKSHVNGIGDGIVGCQWITSDIAGDDTEFSNVFFGIGEHVAIARNAPNVKVLSAFRYSNQITPQDIAEVGLDHCFGWDSCLNWFNLDGKLETIRQWRIGEAICNHDAQVPGGRISAIDPTGSYAPKNLAVIGSVAMGDPLDPGVMNIGSIAGDHCQFRNPNVITGGLSLGANMDKHLLSLSARSHYLLKRLFGISYAQAANQGEDRRQNPIKSIHPVFRDIGADIERFDRRYGYWVVAFFLFSCVPLGIWGAGRSDERGRSDWLGWLLLFTAVVFWVFALVSGLIGRLPWDWWNGNEQEKTSQSSNVHTENVSQNVLTRPNLSYYTNYMANLLSTEKQIGIIGALCEGSSIRSIERMTGVHRDTIMRLGVRAGQGCATLLDSKMRNLSCERLQLDEIWGFVGKKQRNLEVSDDPSLGDAWTFCAIDSDTKLVPAFRVGKRDDITANAFAEDLAARMSNRVQISTDGLGAYIGAIDLAFGGEADFAQVIKTYVTDDSIRPERRYSAPKIITSEKRVVSGSPDMKLASTSHIERLNGTTRLHMRRLTRLTHAFSKKLENFEAAVALHFAYYNLVLRHNTLRCTPAMAAGVEQSFWSVGDLVEAVTA